MRLKNETCRFGNKKKTRRKAADIGFKSKLPAEKVRSSPHDLVMQAASLQPLISHLGRVYTQIKFPHVAVMQVQVEMVTSEFSDQI